MTTLNISPDMKPQDISIDVLLEKYAKNGETTIEAVQTRVAHALAVNEREPEVMAAEFLSAMKSGFVPAGRINSAAGLDSRATLINCFVQPIGDSVSHDGDADPGIYAALGEAAETMRRGGGVGYDFSPIRPLHALVRGTLSRASGPIPFMKVFNTSCATVESAGGRRGAQMGILRCDHPDIFEFVEAKAGGDLTNFNLSIGVTDEFMQAVKSDADFNLVHKAEPMQELINNGAYRRDDGIWVWKTIHARDLWEKIMRNTYDFAEPGIVFLSRINHENNLYYCEEIHATNPCAEQPLPKYGCCCLGSVNLTLFIRNAFTKQASFDKEAFVKVVAIAIRMLDNVLDVTPWPLPQQKAEAMNKRRIGLGFMGLGSALVMLGTRYNSADGREFARFVSETMRDAAYRASIELAKDKGAFPLFDADKYLAGSFAKRLPDDIRNDIAKYGLRNSHNLSIAPTGTISLAFADNPSNGIEPAFSWVYDRKKRMSDNTTLTYEVADHAWRLYRHLGHDVSDNAKLPPEFVTALQMSADDHMQMLKVVQPYIDSAISKTVNVPAEYPYEDFKNLYMNAWESGLKGIATYRPNNILGSVLSEKKTTETSTESDAENIGHAPVVVDVDPLRKQFDGRPLGDLQSVTSKVQYISYEGKKTVYLGISFINAVGVINGQEVMIERPFEFFMPAGQKNDGQQWITASMRLLSMVARSGGSIARALADMHEVVWDKGTVRCGTIQKEGGFSAPRHHDSEVAAIAYALQQMLMRRGFLDASGNQVPVVHMARLSADDGITINNQDADEMVSAPAMTYQPTGKKCPECGSHSLQKRDGCSRCVACHYVGDCG